MCGIIGICKLNDHVSPDNIEAINHMIDAHVHRGPDDSGLYKDDHILLGHRRLSIIDLSSLGHQPMGSDDENLWITHNGEIYNFLDIRKTLESLGYRFRSNTDTEVILKSYQEWGEEAFNRFIGMFAFCLLDKKANLLYLVRDHAGIKPLYYSISNQELIFSSEVKAFRVFNKDWEENRDWRIYFLIFGHIPEPYTTLKDVYMLPKGSFLRLNLKTGNYEIKRFVDISFKAEIKDEREAAELVRNEFTKAIERHLISDALLGVFLSGGIDSSLIASIAHRFQGDNLRTLSVIFNEKEFSEEAYQRLVLNKINSKHNSHLVTENDFMNNLDEIFKAMDQPTIDGINTYFISRCAKEEGLKAVLSGLGGDELFGGYTSFRRIGMFWFLKKINGDFRKPLKVFEHAPNDKFKKLSFLSIDNPISFYLLFRSLFSIKDTAKILDVGESEVSDALKNVYIREDLNMDKGNFASYLETNLYMQNQLLKDTDFMSMRHSIEVRVPFLDKNFMELIFSIKEEIKFDQKTYKFLLIKAFEDILPKEILFRRKMGFTFPFEKWMRNRISTLLDFISDRDKPFIRHLITEFKKGNLHWSRFWSLPVLNVQAKL